MKTSKPLAALLPTVLLLAAALTAGAENAAKTGISKLPFHKYYAPVEYRVKPAVKGYDLPLDRGALERFGPALGLLKVSPDHEFLLQNGFVVSDALKNDDVPKFYEEVRDRGVPLFVTTDSVLHLYHTIFDSMLTELEEKRFYDSLGRILADMDARLVHPAEDASPLMVKARSLARGFLNVAAALLKGTAEAKGPAGAELTLIAAASGFHTSPLFGYKEDYTQYAPRGHYTRSEKLKRYFKAMMWLGRMTFLLKGSNDPEKALVNPEAADVQTLAAALIAEALAGSPLEEEYQRLYRVTSFLVGCSDDLGPRDYFEVLKEVTGGSDAEALLADGMLTRFRAALARRGKPAIYSGTGRIFTGDPKVLAGEPNPEVLNEALAKTAGMRFMGQRFVPDSYFFGKLVAPSVGRFTGNGAPLTGRPYRYFPSSLDLMQLLGSRKAAELLVKHEYASYKGYPKAVAALAKEVSELDGEDWHRNIYLGWLDVLRGVLIPKGEGFQPFQRTDAWELKQLLTASGSWAALRHDTILYVKQSYTLGIKGLPPRPKVIVEPDPEAWGRLLALNRQTKKGLEALGVLLPDVSGRLDFMDEMLGCLLEASVAQLEMREPGKKCKDFLPHIIEAMKRIQEGGHASTVLVADVHSDINTNRALECGTGPMQALGAVCVLPNGERTLAVGPVYTFYEFTRKISERLTDEAWRKMLSIKPPAPPDWLSGLHRQPRPLLDDRF